MLGDGGPRWRLRGRASQGPQRDRGHEVRGRDPAERVAGPGPGSTTAL